MRKYIYLLILTTLSFFVSGQNEISLESNTLKNRSEDFIKSKNFYFFSFLEENEIFCSHLLANAELKTIHLNKVRKLKDVLIDHVRKESEENNMVAIKDIAVIFKFSDAEIKTVSEVLRSLNHNQDLPYFLAKFRESEAFSLFCDKNDEDLLVSSWKQTVKGLNRIIDVYALGKKPEYPKIDSISFSTSDTKFIKLVNFICLDLVDKTEANQLFFKLSENFALWLLRLNSRDEAARFEPLELGENKKAIETLSDLKWNAYSYSMILVPGYGPEKEGVALDPMGIIRCQLAAERYFNGEAPIIFLSGGYVHPFQTSYCEAFEMKKELISNYNIPESSIVIDPFARHTTTNLRNAARFIYKYGVPSDMKILCSTTPDQTDYIASGRFKARCEAELGYLPCTIGKRISPWDIDLLPIKKSLHVDNNDPLDP